MSDILALLIVVGIPALIAYVIALFAFKRFVKTGNSRPRRARIIIFIVSYILLLATEALLLLNSFTLER